MRCLFFILIGFLVNSAVSAQSSGQLQIKVSPDNTIIRLDTLRIKNASLSNHTPGEYRLQMWAPRHRMEERTITLVEGKVKRVYTQLKVSKQWKGYVRKKAFYRGSMFFLRAAVPAGAAIIFGLNANAARNQFIKIKELDSSIESVAESYYQATTQVQVGNFHDEYDRLRSVRESKVKDYNQKLKQSGAVLGIGCAVILVSQLIASKWNEPEFFEDVQLTYSQSQADFGSFHKAGIGMKL